MDVWLKSGFLMPCIRLMWLSRREGRGKLGLSSVQYLQKHGYKRWREKAGSRAQGVRRVGMEAASGSAAESGAGR